MRVPMVFIAVLFLVIAGCAARDPESSELLEKDSHESSILDDPALETKTFPLDNPTSVAGFGAGSLWVTDLGRYRCDDTPGIEASCSSPGRIYLKRLDPETRKTLATIPLRGTNHATVAFGAGSAWISYGNYSSPSESGVLRLDPETNRITHKIPVKVPGRITFANGAAWIVTEGALVRIDPETNGVVERIEIGEDVGGIAFGEGALWVASYGTSRENDASVGKEITRMDPETGEIVAKIPVEAQALEGGASDVAIGGEAVWVTSVNGKLLRVDPETNEIVATIDLGDYSFDVETGAGAVWATSEVNVHVAKGYTHRLTRVDPESNEVSGRADLDDLSGLAIFGGDAWLGRSNIETGKGGLTRTTP